MSGGLVLLLPISDLGGVAQKRPALMAENMILKIRLFIQSASIFVNAHSLSWIYDPYPHGLQSAQRTNIFLSRPVLVHYFVSLFVKS